MPKGQTRILLIYNPQGVVDRDIYLASKSGPILVEPFEIDISRSLEGHTLERMDLLKIGQSILSFHPDFILTINGCGLDNEGFFAYFCAYLGLPLVLWYVDEPFIVPEWGRKFIPKTTVAFTFDHFYERRLKEWGIFRVGTLPLGANPERLLGYHCSQSSPNPCTNVLSFVGTLDYEKIRYLLQNIESAWSSMPPGMVDVLDRAVHEYRKNFQRETEEVVRDCARALGVEVEFPNGIVRQMILSFIDREAGFRQRHEIVERLKPFGISVYGEPFWSRAVGESCYKGQINYYSRQIADLYSSSRINLNISKYQLKTTVNQRVFDCPLCDGFLLTDFREDIEEYFEIDKEIAVYRGIEDLRRKVAYFLGNQGAAKAIAKNGKAATLARHTYQHRLRRMAGELEGVSMDPCFIRSCESVREGPGPQNFPLFLEKLGLERSPNRIPGISGRDFTAPLCRISN